MSNTICMIFMAAAFTIIEVLIITFKFNGKNNGIVTIIISIIAIVSIYYYYIFG